MYVTIISVIFWVGWGVVLIFTFLNSHFCFRQGEEVACTIQSNADEANGKYRDYTGATATALLSAQLPIPIKLCKLSL